MDIYPIKKREGMVRRIEVKEIVRAVSLMVFRVKKNEANVIFFPEAGALPLKYIFQRLTADKKYSSIKLFSSKITASTKASLGKQICSILCPVEKKAYLTANQVSDFMVALNNLPQPVKKLVEKNIDVGHMDRLSISELILAISEIGLYIPGEDKANWVKEGIVKNIDYSPDNHSLKDFQSFRKKTTAYIIDSISKITHETRPLLNIILAQTKFARTINQNTIYVIDEAISRGRTLNAIEIIFKAFCKDAKWRIGVLFCQLDVAGRGNVDFILSTSLIPLFSNRFDLIGDIVVESDSGFVKYEVDSLLLRAKKISVRPNKNKVEEYFKKIRTYVRSRFSQFLQPELVYEEDLVRLLHFIFECDEEKIIRRCIDLNPIKIKGLIEEASFYINMPHPFDPMPVRKKYKDTMLDFLEYIKGMPAGSADAKELSKIKKEFHSVKKDYERGELESWSEHYHKILFEIGQALNHTKT